jgi:pilus assembly protein Flp/PilA
MGMARLSMLAQLLKRFIRERDGNTAMEYALIAALVFLAAVAGIQNYTTSMTNMYNYVSARISEQL